MAQCTMQLGSLLGTKALSLSVALPSSGTFHLGTHYNGVVNPLASIKNPNWLQTRENESNCVLLKCDLAIG